MEAWRHASTRPDHRLAGNDILHEPVAVLGAGSWGTALAIQFGRAGHPTRLWCRNAADAAQMTDERLAMAAAIYGLSPAQQRLVQRIVGGESLVDIARRTVAKYREAMNIPSSVQRRREKRALATLRR